LPLPRAPERILVSMRLLLIDSAPTPYSMSFFNAAGRRPGMKVRVVFLAPSDSNRSWKVDLEQLAVEHRVLPGVRTYLEPIELPLYLHWGLWSEMRRFRPDAIAIGGYHYSATLEVLAYARINQCATVLWSGSHLLSGFIKQRLADAYKRWVITRFDAYLSYGSAARDQLVHYGASPNRIVVGCNTVDVHWFKRQADELRPPRNPAGALRLFFVGRLVALKNVAALISAVGRLQKRGLDMTLMIVGDGPLRESLREQVDREGVRNVTFAGFQSGRALVQGYVNSDALILPSLNEVWGLVVNEAAACGVPAIVSTRAGAARDLIRDEETGLTFDPGVQGELEWGIERLARDRELCRRMGEAARRFILTRDQKYYADRLMEAAELALVTRAHQADRRRLSSRSSN
jgi:glycosyltransferase involved in cell wall biosynthesis